jgi:glutamine kinase
MIISTKAQTLANLSSVVEKFTVPHLYFFTVKEWQGSQDTIIDNIYRSFSKVDGNKNAQLVVRSSAIDEDGEYSAKAGEYDSILNVPLNDESALVSAIDAVIASYELKREIFPGDEVIVQKMIENPIMSGVVFTHDLNTGAPYYVINYDDISGLTNTVTAGDNEYANRTLYIHRSSIGKLRSDRFMVLLAAIAQLEKTIDSQFLDIEFAMDGDLVPYLLQVRAISTRPNWNRAISKRIDQTLLGVERFVSSKFTRQSGIFGETTIFGQMPDWNPAEMIGRAPRQLAYSLYQVLITDHAWRIARREMGYRVPDGQPLMVSLGGQPFIDTRLSFHSYLPAKLDSKLSDQLVHACIRRLCEHPEYHDKVEFDVAITTFSFDIDTKLKSRYGDVLSDDQQKQFVDILKEQTQNLVMDSGIGSIPEALFRIQQLKEIQAEQDAVKQISSIHQLFNLIDDCMIFGTIPFSILARHGFIAKTLLNSLVSLGILSIDEADLFQNGVRTIASDLVHDMKKYQLGEMSHEAFINSYGHLRPGTYDILSIRYDQMKNLGNNEIQPQEEAKLRPFELTNEQKGLIDTLLIENGFKKLDAEGLFNYFSEAIKGREYGKFIFTRSLSHILEVVADLGEENGLSRDEMSYIPVTELLNIAKTSIDGSIEDWLRDISERNQQMHQVSAAMRLPQVLFDVEGVHVIPFQVSHPNFITGKKVTGPTIFLKQGMEDPILVNKIVLIEGADPGFDWIFSQNILGLITKYGGANSHMAIRCAEFGIPAAIGCGEQRFDSIKQSNQIMLDCAASLITTI